MKPLSPREREGPAAELWEGEVVLTYDTARTGSVARARSLRRNRVIPAKAGTQPSNSGAMAAAWIPAFAGTTN